MDIFIHPVCLTLFCQCHNSLVSHTEFVLVDQRSQILIIQIVHCCRRVTDSVYLQSCLFSLRMALVFLPQCRCLFRRILVQRHCLSVALQNLRYHIHDLFGLFSGLIYYFNFFSGCF